MDKDQLEGYFIEFDHDEQTDSEFDENDYFSCSDYEEYSEEIDKLSLYPDIGLVDIPGRKLRELDMKALRIYSDCKKDEIFIAKTKELFDIMSSGSELESEDEEDEDNEFSTYWRNFEDIFNKVALSRAMRMKRIEKKIHKNTEIISRLSALTIRPKDEITEERRARKKAFKEYTKERVREKKGNKGAFMAEIEKQQKLEFYIRKRRRFLTFFAPACVFLGEVITDKVHYK